MRALDCSGRATQITRFGRNADSQASGQVVDHIEASARVLPDLLLGAILAIWLAFMAVGWIFAMVRTFVIIGLIEVVVFVAVSLLSKRARRG